MSLGKLCLKKIFESYTGYPELELVPLFSTCPWLVRNLVQDALDYPETTIANVLLLFPVSFLPLFFEGIQYE